MLISNYQKLAVARPGNRDPAIPAITQIQTFEDESNLSLIATGAKPMKVDALKKPYKKFVDKIW